MRRLVATLVVIAAPVLAQAKGGPAVSAAMEHWKSSHDNIVKSAEQLPESLFAFKPTPKVRSFAELFGHVAGSEIMFCAAARGEANADKHEGDFEGKVKDKAGLVKALKDAGAYCAVAYSMSDADAAAMVDLFGKRSKLNSLIFNAAHDGEHYGNIVTYLRLKGMVPPSSQGQ